MIGRLAILICLSLLSLAHGQQFAVLSPAAQQDVNDSPYRSALLTVENMTSKIIRSVNIRCRDGGPVLSLPAAIAPDVTTTIWWP